MAENEIPSIILPRGDDWIVRVRTRAEQYMRRYESCSQSVLSAFMEEFGIRDPLVLAAAGGLHGGLTASLTCGVHTGGAMVLGLLMGRTRIEQGLDGLFPIMLPMQELMARLNRRLGSHSCRELTGVDFTDLDQAIKFFASEGHEKCIARVADGAEEISIFLKELNERSQLFRPRLG
jgi:C_GCAxxG_C_C family probable redox protein